MLILFDIDGTLLLSGGAGRQSMMVAGRRVMGDAFTFDGIDFAGRLDPLIWGEAAAANGIDDPAAHHDEFRSVYTSVLEARLRDEPSAEALPGVLPLLDALAGQPNLALGVLTGNYPETGRMKLRAAGIDPERFAVGAWGSDGPTRRHLPPVAIERFSERTGRRPDPGTVVIIGDTPHDIDCARASGCRVIAVATGPSYEHATLAALDPDLALHDLTDTAVIVDWLVGVAAASDQGVV